MSTLDVYKTLVHLWGLAAGMRAVQYRAEAAGAEPPAELLALVSDAQQTLNTLGVKVQQEQARRSFLARL